MFLINLQSALMFNNKIIRGFKFLELLLLLRVDEWLYFSREPSRNHMSNRRSRVDPVGAVDGVVHSTSSFEHDLDL